MHLCLRSVVVEERKDQGPFWLSDVSATRHLPFVTCSAVYYVHLMFYASSSTLFCASYLLTHPSIWSRVSEQWGMLERSVTAKDDLTLTTEQYVITSYRYSLLTFAVMGTR